jgi:hypothetical protein
VLTSVTVRQMLHGEITKHTAACYSLLIACTTSAEETTCLPSLVLHFVQYEYEIRKEIEIERHNVREAKHRIVTKILSSNRNGSRKRLFLQRQNHINMKLHFSSQHSCDKMLAFWDIASCSLTEVDLQRDYTAPCRGRPLSCS